MPFSMPLRSRPVDDLLSCIEYWFDDKYQADDENWPSARFLVRGGICWPDQYDERTDTIQGCALIAGYNLTTDRAYVFEEIPFTCIDHILDPVTRKILFTGLAPWFSHVYSKFLGDTFYVCQPDPVRDRWERETRNTAALQVNPPRFVPCQPWGDVGKVESLLWEWFTRRRVMRYNDGPLEAEIGRYRRGDEKLLPPAMHALACCLTGMATQIEQAREIARAPQSLVGKVKNQLMLEHPRDWRGS